MEQSKSLKEWLERATTETLVLFVSIHKEIIEKDEQLIDSYTTAIQARTETVKAIENEINKRCNDIYEKHHQPTNDSHRPNGLESRGMTTATDKEKTED
jgi:hypothetical protein